MQDLDVEELLNSVERHLMLNGGLHGHHVPRLCNYSTPDTHMMHPSSSLRVCDSSNCTIVPSVTLVTIRIIGSCNNPHEQVTG